MVFNFNIQSQQVIELNKSGFSHYVNQNVVSLLQFSQARIIPIFIDRDDEYLRNILAKVNAVVGHGSNENIYD